MKKISCAGKISLLCLCACSFVWRKFRKPMEHWQIILLECCCCPPQQQQTTAAIEEKREPGSIWIDRQTGTFFLPAGELYSAPLIFCCFGGRCTIRVIHEAVFFLPFISLDLRNADDGPVCWSSNDLNIGKRGAVSVLSMEKGCVVYLT